MDIHPVTRNPDHIAVVAVHGELDLASVGKLLVSMRELLSSDLLLIGLDLSPVTFLDCSGLRGLLALERDARSVGTVVRLVATSPAVEKVLDLIRLPAGSCFLAVPLAELAPNVYRLHRSFPPHSGEGPPRRTPSPSSCPRPETTTTP